MNASCNIEILGCNSFRKINSFNFFVYKSLSDQILSWRKIGQKQYSVIIWMIFVVFVFLMLYTKFQGHRSVGYREEHWLIFNHIWAWWPRWSCDQVHLNNFSSPIYGGPHMKFGYNWPSGFRREVVWNYRRQRRSLFFLQSPPKLSAQVSLKPFSCWFCAKLLCRQGQHLHICLYDLPTFFSVSFLLFV